MTRGGNFKKIGDWCYIDKRNAQNQRLIAAKAIPRGQRIIEERALYECDVGPTRLYDPATFFDENAKRHVVDELMADYKRLNKTDQMHFDLLHHGDGGVAKAVSLNCFDYTERRNGQSHRILRVYRDIARVNHSCYPNAVASWNSELGKGTLHAIAAIAEGQEIFIDYMSPAESCLRSREDRRGSLSSHYGFGCSCETCGQNDRDCKADDKIRAKALELRADGFYDTRLDKAARVQEVKRTTQYIEELCKLFPLELKVAEAYTHLGSLHKAAYYESNRLPDHTAHCDQCKADRSNSHHADAAVQAFDQAHNLHVRCLGQDHRTVWSTEAESRVMKGLRDGAPSPQRP